MLFYSRAIQKWVTYILVTIFLVTQGVVPKGMMPSSESDHWFEVCHSLAINQPLIDIINTSASVAIDHHLHHQTRQSSNPSEHTSYNSNAKCDFGSALKNAFLAHWSNTIGVPVSLADGFFTFYSTIVFTTRFILPHDRAPPPSH